MLIQTVPYQDLDTEVNHVTSEIVIDRVMGPDGELIGMFHKCSYMFDNIHSHINAIQ